MSSSRSARLDRDRNIADGSSTETAVNVVANDNRFGAGRHHRGDVLVRRLLGVPSAVGEPSRDHPIGARPRRRPPDRPRARPSRAKGSRGCCQPELPRRSGRPRRRPTPKGHGSASASQTASDPVPPGGFGGTAHRKDEAYQVGDLVERLRRVAVLPRQQRPGGDERQCAALHRSRDPADTPQARESIPRGSRPLLHRRPKVEIAQTAILP